MSTIILDHPAIVNHYDSVIDIYKQMDSFELTKKTLGNWIALVEFHCKDIGSHFLKAEDIEPELKKQLIEDEKNKFRGDMFEIFSEIFFKLSPADNRFGLTNYQVTNSDDDYGVDATGINYANHPTVVQCKYRMNFNSENSMISYEDIAKTYADGKLRLKYELTQPHTICLITTSKSISYIIGKIFGNLFVEINGKNLESCVNKNANFWTLAHQSIINVMEE